MNQKKSQNLMYGELAPYYDIIYQWKNYQAECRKLHRLITKYKKSPGKRLLDVACGTGEHLKYLREHYDVTGLDFSPAMLKLARRKLPDLTFVRGNMLSFHLRTKFDLMLCLFSAIAHLQNYSNLHQALRNFSSHLVSGGVLLIEPFVSKEKFMTGMIHSLTQSAGGVTVTRMNASRRRGNLAILDFHFLVGTRQGVRYYKDLHILGLFDPKRFVQMLEQEGFHARFLKNGLMKDRGLFVAVKD
ncbi:MAG: class I SAM-dependent methyltransferase [bacterium]